MENELRAIALRRIAEISSDLLIVSDASGHIVHANEQFFTRLGYTPSDIAAKAVRAASLYAGGEKEARRVTLRLMKNTVLQNYRTRLHAADRARLIDVNLTLVGVPPCSRSPSWIVGINRDIMELERLFREVREIELDNYAAPFLQSAHSAAAFLTDRSGRIIYCTGAILETVGFHAEELLGRKVFGLFWGGRDAERHFLRSSLKHRDRNRRPADLYWQPCSLKHKKGHEVSARMTHRFYSSDPENEHRVTSVLLIVQELSRVKRTAFLSYAEEDSAQTRQIAKALKCLGIKTWMYEMDLRVSRPIPSEIEHAIDRCDFFIAFMSPHALKSDWCRDELDQALMVEKERDMSIVPVLLRACQIPSRIRTRRYADFTAGLAKGLVDLLGHVCPEHLASPVVLALQAVLPNDR